MDAIKARAKDALQEVPLLQVRELSKLYAAGKGCAEVSFELYPGEVLGIVGESGSGKTTLLKVLAGNLAADRGSILYHLSEPSSRQPETSHNQPETSHNQGDRSNIVDICLLPEAKRRQLLRSEWGFVQQNPRDGLRLRVSAGANIGERLMAIGARHYGEIRAKGISWLEEVEIDARCIDDRPQTFSGGMQQRLQIARNLVTQPRLVFMDEPTGGLDVSVQARLLDLLRTLVTNLQLSMIIVTHDLAVARLLAHRLLVMYQGKVVEQGLTDQILDDPQHPYSQLLVSSVLTP